ncbi:MAG: guanylate kinase [Rhodothermaceae bacterium]|nr:guanylate kinase [Rhodothermaceae bacterium]
MKLIVLTAPSGAGKTTIARRVMDEVPGLRFSTSATTRTPREGEQHGVEYFFLTEAEFQARIEADAFVEYEEVYPGRYYGTLRDELERLAESTAVVLDVDVKGALNVKRLYGDKALTLFIAPPSLDALADRLHARGTETEERIAVRLSRATLELDFAHDFDAVIVNDDLETAVAETVARVQAFLRG